MGIVVFMEFRLTSLYRNKIQQDFSRQM